jgi:hypothetical protein
VLDGVRTKIALAACGLTLAMVPLACTTTDTRQLVNQPKLTAAQFSKTVGLTIPPSAQKWESLGRVDNDSWYDARFELSPDQTKAFLKSYELRKDFYEFTNSNATPFMTPSKSAHLYSAANRSKKGFNVFALVEEDVDPNVIYLNTFE